MSAAGSMVVAERYARALLDVVLDKNVDPDQVRGELDEMARLLNDHPKLADALSTPAIASDKRVAVLDEVIAKQGLTPSTVNLLRLLVARERMSILGVVAEHFRRLVLEHKLIQHGEVTSAYPLNEKQQQRLADGLGEALGKTMELSFKNDKNIVGGIVVRIGNRVFDASVMTQLERFKEKTLSSL